MPRGNAKSRVAFSKIRNKAGVFVTNPKDINNIEENMDILEDWECEILIKCGHKGTQDKEIAPAISTLSYREDILAQSK
ncbi:22358_t:CDS:2 [Gigaspora rosea]|nr:22358_t:CDS:2 [Gigaspora rosea]